MDSCSHCRRNCKSYCSACHGETTAPAIQRAHVSSDGHSNDDAHGAADEPAVQFFAVDRAYMAPDATYSQPHV